MRRLRLLLGLPLLAAAPALPSVTTPLRTGVKNTQDAAVVIGLSRYPYGTDVPFAAEDAEAFQNFLVYTRGIPASRVHLIETDGSRENILHALDQLGHEVGPNGVAWVYFAGHGAASPTTEERLLLGDDVRSNKTSLDARGVALSEVELRAGAGGGRVVAVIDACYVGVGRDGQDLVDTRLRVPVDTATVSVATKPSDSASRRATAERTTEWLAVENDEVAGVMPGAAHGAFTYTVIGALRGWADGELDDRRDGKVTLTEADLYLHRALNEAGVRTQHPVLLNAPVDFVVSTRVAEVSPTFAGDTVASRPGEAPATTSSSPGAAQVVVGGGDYAAQLAALTATQDNADATAALAARIEAERQRNIAEVTKKLRTEATAAWALAKPLVAREGETARQAAMLYLQKYSTAKVNIDGVDYGVAIAEAAEAQRVILSMEGATSPGVDTGARGFGDEVVSIPAGTFMMGSPTNEAGRSEYEKQHKVTVVGFKMAQTEVSNALWREVMGTTPSSSYPLKRLPLYTPGVPFSATAEKSSLNPRDPVHGVSWCDVLAFANKLSVRQYMREAYSDIECTGHNASALWNRGASGWRLPTEEEWEYAARGGTTKVYGAVDTVGDVCYVGNVEGAATCDDGHEGLAPVATYLANGYGLYDMVGNVAELVWTQYNDAAVLTEQPAERLFFSAPHSRGGTFAEGPLEQRIAAHATPQLSLEFRVGGGPVGVRLVR